MLAVGSVLTRPVLVGVRRLPASAALVAHDNRRKWRASLPLVIGLLAAPGRLSRRDVVKAIRFLLRRGR